MQKLNKELHLKNGTTYTQVQSEHLSFLPSNLATIYNKEIKINKDYKFTTQTESII